MSVDTRDKRASAHGFLIAPLPLPDGAMSEADRPHVAWLYRGLSYAVAPDVHGCATVAITTGSTTTAVTYAKGTATTAVTTPAVVGSLTVTIEED